MEAKLPLDIDQHSAVPIYHQIADEIRQLIASGKLKPGSRLPTVRGLAAALNVNQNTVVRAYLELEQQRVITSRRGGGTTVAAVTDDPVSRTMRQKRLSDIISDDILKVLSLNYSPEEVQAAFHLHMARWRAGRAAQPEIEEVQQEPEAEATIRFTGSHDLAFSLLVDLLLKEGNTKVAVTNSGSLGGLIALQEGRADLAGIHLLDEETGEYNYPYVKRILPGRSIVVIHLACRMQGLMFAEGNPKNITGLLDLRRQDVIFANRQQGSGTRVLLDLKLRENAIAAGEVQGYERELNTHLDVGLCIANHEADAGLGIAAAARSCSLGFLPLFRERYDLVMFDAAFRNAAMDPLLAMIGSDGFRKMVDEIGGYDTSEMGKTLTLRT